MMCPVVAALHARADADPSGVAIHCKDGVTVTFAELVAQADAVAAELLAQRGPGSEPIALGVSDPARMLAAQFGVLTAGKFYVAVNPLFPQARRQAMLAQVQPAVMITDKEAGHAQEPGSADGMTWIEIEQVLALAGTAERPVVSVDPDSLAYVLYTSGSTGQPRGIAHSRRDMLQNLERHAAFGLSGADCTTLISSDGFVSAISNVYIPLLSGSALAPYSFHADGVHELIPWLRSTGVTVYYSFPSFLRRAVAVADGASAPGVRLAYLGGEPVRPDDLAAARQLFPNATLGVGLNSTETGLTRLTLVPPGAPLPARVSVGAAVPGVDVAVVDLDGQDLAAGEPGEIVIRSAFVQPRLWGTGTVSTLAPEVPGRPGVYEYRTGDRGEFTADGDLVHLGRADGMLKIRGFRVELTEVEAALAGLDVVAEAAATSYDSGQGELELAAYVVARDAALTAVEVRRRLAGVLPAPMVPATVTFVDALPRTRNGKVDRQALPTLNTTAASAPADEAGSEASIEDRILAIWRAVLRSPSITAADEFFDAGGTSITALNVISRVRKEFGVPIRLAVLFDDPTVAALADEVRLLSGPGASEEQQ